MENLLQDNKNCADCDSENVTNANMDKGITLCAECAKAHQRILKIPCRNLDELNEEEISYINKQGNVKSNSALMKNVMQWTISLKYNNNHLVRDWFIEAKYEKQQFSREAIKRKPQYDFNEMWYFIDEVSRETPWAKGPYNRRAIRKMIEDKRLLFRDSFIWHPVLGSKWMRVDRIYDIICPSSNLSDSSLHDACLRKLYLQSLPHPHLRGPLDVLASGYIGRKWVIIQNKQIDFHSIGSLQITEKTINIEDINDISLFVGNNGKLCINVHVEDNENSVQLCAVKTDEVIEWYHAISCCRHLILALGTEFPTLEVDQSELTYCNVKSSIEYAGEKIHEGILKQQGRKWASQKLKSRWVVLRASTLSFFKSKQEKLAKKVLRITGSSSIDLKKDNKNVLHLYFTNPERELHLLTEGQADKDLWCEKFLQAVEKVRIIEDERIG